MLRVLLIWAIISCGVEDSLSSNRYRIDVEGLVDGKHVYLGTKLTGISVKVTKFLILTEYGDGDVKKSITDEGAVTSGSLQVDVECYDKQAFSKKLTITSETTKIPEVTLADDKFEHGSCDLIVVYDDGETEHPNRDKQTIDFRIVEEGYCEDNSNQPTEYIIGKGFEKRCAKQSFELTQQCDDNLRLFYYTKYQTNLLSSESLDTDSVVVVMTGDDDSWSIPKGCNLKINNRVFALTKPSAGQNLAQDVEITSVSANVYQDGGKIKIEANSEGDQNLYLTVGNNWYRHSLNSAGETNTDLAYPNDLRKLAIMTHKEGWWSYLAGPQNIHSIDNGQPMRAGQPIVVNESDPPPPPKP